MGRFELPLLATNHIYLNAHLECSPVSLTLAHNSGDKHHLLADGAGIMAITLEILYIPVPGRGEHALPPDTSSWTSTSCCCLIQPFHDAAQRSLMETRDSSDTIPTHCYGGWAPSALSWMQRHPVRPTRDAICGYRVATAGEAFNDLDGVLGGVANLEHHTLRIFDLNPVHIRRARHVGARGKTPLQFYNSLHVLPLLEESRQNRDDLDPPSTSYERVIVTRASPTADSLVFQREAEHYATNAPTF